MCFGGTPKYDPPPTPAVEPAPTPTELAKATAAIPPSVATQSPKPTTIAADEKRKKTAAMRYGMMSTVKTGPQGIKAAGVAGTGANLETDATGKKTTLGS